VDEEEAQLAHKLLLLRKNAFIQGAVVGHTVFEHAQAIPEGDHKQDGEKEAQDRSPVTHNRQ
jgi:hypothetical protein